MSEMSKEQLAGFRQDVRRNAVQFWEEEAKRAWFVALLDTIDARDARIGELEARETEVRREAADKTTASIVGSLQRMIQEGIVLPEVENLLDKVRREARAEALAQAADTIEDRLTDPNNSYPKAYQIVLQELFKEIVALSPDPHYRERIMNGNL